MGRDPSECVPLSSSFRCSDRDCCRGVVVLEGMRISFSVGGDVFGREIGGYAALKNSGLAGWG